MVAAAVVVVVVVLVAVVVATRGGDSSGGGSTATGSNAARLADSPEAKWTVDFDGSGSVIGDGSSVFVSSLTTDGLTVTALAAGDGSRRWEQSFNADTGDVVAVRSGGVVITRKDEDGDTTFALLAGKAGTPKWEVSADGDLVTVGDRSYIVFYGDDGGARLRTIDLGTGKLGVLRQAAAGFPHAEGRFIGYGDGSAQIYDAAATPTGTPIAIDSDTVSVTLVGGRLVALDAKAVTAFDAKGKRLWRSTASSDSPYSVSNVDGHLVVYGNDATVVGDIGSSGVEERWRTRDNVVGVVGGGSELVLAESSDYRIVSIADGVEQGRIADAAADGSGATSFASNGLVVSSSHGSDTRSDAYDLKGAPKWRIDGEVTVGDRWVAAIERDSDEFHVTYYR